MTSVLSACPVASSASSTSPSRSSSSVQIGPVVGDGLAHLVFAQLVPQLAALALEDARLVFQRVAVAGAAAGISAGSYILTNFSGTLKGSCGPIGPTKRHQGASCCGQIVQGGDGCLHHFVIVQVFVALGPAVGQRLVEFVVALAGAAHVPAAAGRRHPGRRGPRATGRWSACARLLCWP